MEEILGGRDGGNPWCRDGGNPWGERWRKSLRGVYGGNPQGGYMEEILEGRGGENPWGRDGGNPWGRDG